MYTYTMSFFLFFYSSYFPQRGGPFLAIVQDQADPWNSASKPATVPNSKNNITLNLLDE